MTLEGPAGVTMRDDFLIFEPGDVDLARSPLRAGIAAETFVLGAFNPGLTRLPSGNLLLMVRVAEALAEPVAGGKVRAMRWTADGYTIDSHPLDHADLSDPRVFALPSGAHRAIGLTSLSWLLPVELSGDGERVVAVHYDKAIAPHAGWQSYGIEDPRIALIGGSWYMTVACVAPGRIATALYVSVNGLDYKCQGLIAEHQNKDFVLFSGRVGGRFMALTRPQGETHIVPPPEAGWLAGPAIHFAASPDGLHWRPIEGEGIRPRPGPTGRKVGGGTPPLLTDRGWLTLFHGVDREGPIGIYRTFWALLDKEDPGIVREIADHAPLLEANPALVPADDPRRYLPGAVVFTTGIHDAGEHYLLASGEADLACRMTRIDKARFAASEA